MSLGTTVPHTGRPHMKPPALEAFAAFVGLDWADAKHAICLQAAGTERREFLVLEHRPEAIDAWVQILRTRFNGQPVAVCLGFPRALSRPSVHPGEVPRSVYPEPCQR